MSFKVTHRGAPRQIVSEFRCPAHGRFEALVESGADSAPCPVIVTASIHRGITVELGWMETQPGAVQQIDAPCRLGAASPWSPSKAPPMRMRRVEAVRGKNEQAEHKSWGNTLNLEEGQDFDDWQADRDADAEQRRKELVTEMVRSDR